LINGDTQFEVHIGIATAFFGGQRHDPRDFRENTGALRVGHPFFVFYSCPMRMSGHIEA
jgi:hypothetical protein